MDRFGIRNKKGMVRRARFELANPYEISPLTVDGSVRVWDLNPAPLTWLGNLRVTRMNTMVLI